MNYTKILIIIFILFSLALNAQKISNVRFEQVGKQIHIYYDLQGEVNFNVNVYCREDGGNTWGNPLVNVTGAIGKNQKTGANKMIIWDVLKEKIKLSGDIMFKVEVNPLSGYFIDKRDGNRYKWVSIGEQVWMAENLAFKTSPSSWAYNNDESNVDKYGRLYDWKTAIEACPEGWHLPTDKEWKTLEKHLGMSQSEADNYDYRGTNEGKKLKSTSSWFDSGNGIDAVGFTALPGGYCNAYDFFYIGGGGAWWSATEYGSPGAWGRELNFYYDGVKRFGNYKEGGLSVRCIRN